MYHWARRAFAMGRALAAAGFAVPVVLLVGRSGRAGLLVTADAGGEDLLVALADNCWKGRRPGPLEEKIVETIQLASGREKWQVFSALDEILQQLTADAEARLAWQAEFPVRPGT